MFSKRMLLALGLVAALTACSSGVKLSDVPVEDKSGSRVVPGAQAGGGQTGATQSQVTPVAVDPKAGAMPGPTGVGKIVYFDYDSYVIKPEFQALIESHARFLKANGARKVNIEGHTDERGGREYNLALGQKRSEAVRRAMGLLGVTDTQVEAVSFGKEKPAATGSDEQAWSQNRRAEIAYR
ncbi:MAG TPA: peptidoglycan-associated lipoprotein Pal [Ramlibacter sp.]|nr:peptidoglycan-associated lipoprotein Pal [Ramlibacter sp.]